MAALVNQGVGNLTTKRHWRRSRVAITQTYSRKLKIMQLSFGLRKFPHSGPGVGFGLISGVKNGPMLKMPWGV
jgi:hypothetical protein